MTTPRSTSLPFAQPDIDETELAQIKEALESGWITTGPKTRQFEAAFAAVVGAEHTVAVSSCTAALHLALEAAGVGPGDEVITSPYTFASTGAVVRHLNAQPVFVDVDPDSLNIRPDLLERAITGRTRAIVPVHIAGSPAELDDIYNLAARYDLAVVEDAAHAFPAKYGEHMIGSSSARLNGRVPHLACFSFYAIKTITTGEGGMICTGDATLAEHCRSMSLHGMSRDAWKRYADQGSWYYEIVAPGYKYNMTDIAAGMGLAQLARAERMWQRRTTIAQRYNEAFGQVIELQPPSERPDGQHAWHLYMLRLNLERLTIGRSEFIEELRGLNIGTSVHFIPLHIHPYYRDTYGYRPEDFPVAYREYEREISLPIYSKMTDQDVEDVIAAVLDVVRRYGR